MDIPVIFWGMKTQILGCALLSCFLVNSAAQSPAAQPPKSERLTPRISVIVAGFNGAITVFESKDGTVVVDCADPGSAPAVQSMIRAIDQRTPAAVILTHYHGDHVGAAATLAAGSTVFAHQDCLDSFKKQNPTGYESLSKVARLHPYAAAGSQMQIGDDNTIRLIHPAHAHSSGDTVIVFEKEKVISAGDLFFNGVPPYIDVADGADTALWADTIDRLSKQYAGFKVVPGHGPVNDTEGWKQFAVYLRALRQGVADAIKAGQTREQAQASVNLDQFTTIKDYGNFLTKKANIGWVYDELTKK